MLKVLSLISDCNKYVLSEDYPPTIIDIAEYIAQMDSQNFTRNPLAVDQAFSDLPQVYKGELINRLYSSYEGDSISSDLRGNIEFCGPILWKALTKEDKSQIGKRFEKTVLSGDAARIARGQVFLHQVAGMMYVNSATRRVLIEPIVASMANALDDWTEESRLAAQLQQFSSFVPVELIDSYVSAITKSYIGYRGSSPQWNRTDFYSNGAAQPIKEMFESFDSAAVDAFVEIVRNDSVLRRRIAGRGQLNRLRVLAELLIERGLGSDASKNFLALLADPERTGDFYAELPKLAD
ncbi:hypothetical protein Y882_08040 [Dyella japonica DSM 16301]|uniref:Uncharacterized protein n=1 Tax=Dyella japonica DSM 16301 TaxID=1440762 RepID=A0A0G9H4A7_9GAMM|nr:hypothetical protein Y882_08040 [Dyella japonica DSM 16301]